MIEAEELQREYRPVHGDPKNLKGNMVVGILHLHLWGDTTSPAGGILDELIINRADVAGITDHDVDSYDMASRKRDKLSRRRGHHLELVRASEITAAGNRHVLVFGFNRLPVSGQPIERLLEEANKQNAFVSLVHPELGDFSVTEPEIEALVENDAPPFAIEVHSGAVSQIDRAELYPLPGFIRRRIPDAGSNRRSKQLFESFKGKLLGGTGGPDAHNRRHAMDVITCGPEGMDLFDAIKQGKSVIMERKKLPRSTATNLVVGHVRGRLLERKRQRNA